MNKKMLILIIGVLLGIGLVACSSSSPGKEIESTPTRVTASNTPEPEEVRMYIMEFFMLWILFNY